MWVYAWSPEETHPWSWNGWGQLSPSPLPKQEGLLSTEFPSAQGVAHFVPIFLYLPGIRWTRFQSGNPEMPSLASSFRGGSVCHRLAWAWQSWPAYPAVAPRMGWVGRCGLWVIGQVPRSLRSDPTAPTLDFLFPVTASKIPPSSVSHALKSFMGLS